MNHISVHPRVDYSKNPALDSTLTNCGSQTKSSPSTHVSALQLHCSCLFGASRIHHANSRIHDVGVTCHSTETQYSCMTYNGCDWKAVKDHVEGLPQLQTVPTLALVVESVQRKISSLHSFVSTHPCSTSTPYGNMEKAEGGGGGGGQTHKCG